MHYNSELFFSRTVTDEYMVSIVRIARFMHWSRKDIFDMTMEELLYWNEKIKEIGYL